MSMFDELMEYEAGKLDRHTVEMFPTVDRHWLGLAITRQLRPGSDSHD